MAMDYRSLGRSGLKVSPLRIGSFNFSNPTTEEETDAIVDRAIAAGINFFDTSNNYNEGCATSWRFSSGSHAIIDLG
jgi:1-deoxyxylulose-5-phosphate synthase